jgi:meso-butanediol dehydrogenase / (S,S)-butanediol dehydrogenase / diacetyl reductase
MRGRLAGKVAVVTGSTRGIGEGIARLFAEEGAEVIVTGRKQEAGIAIEASIRDAGGHARFLPLDLEQEDSVAAMFAEIERTHGRLDILVNNAAPTELHGWGKTDNAIDKLSLADWHKLNRAGPDGFFLACRYALPLLLASGKASMINISTAASILAIAGMDGYTALKGAVNALTRSMAVTYAARGVRCNAVIVGGIQTPGLKGLADEGWLKVAAEANPMKRLGEPRDIGFACLYLASDEARFVTGTQVTVDGGMLAELKLPSLAASH